jgi:ribonuclease Z
VEVIVLGSGTPNPDPGRAGASVAVVEQDSWLMVDCGRSATMRAVAAGLDLARLMGVFITHHHSDHISDLATLAIARWTAGCPTPLAVHAPVGPATKFASTCLDPFDDDCFHRQADRAAGPRPQIEVFPFTATSSVTTVIEADG